MYIVKMQEELQEVLLSRSVEDSHFTGVDQIQFGCRRKNIIWRDRVRRNGLCEAEEQG